MNCLNDARIDLKSAEKKIAAFFARYDETDPGNRLKIIHTYHVAQNAKKLAERMNLSECDRDLAVLIALLHDIGRFEELKVTKEFNSARFDHAAYGVKMLKEGMIREFIESDVYDQIIFTAIGAHSRLSLPLIRDERTCLQAKLIRDADKLDNFRVKIEEKVENIFPGRITTRESVEESYISEAVYEALSHQRCVDVKDRVTPLDYFMTIVGFYFDLNFEESRQIVHEEKLLERMVGRFDYKDENTKAQIAYIMSLCNEKQK